MKQIITTFIILIGGLLGSCSPADDQKFENKKILSIDSSVSSDNQMITKKDTIISEQKAIEIATLDAGFLGTWVSAELKNDYWHIQSSSKSANPPMYYIVNAKDGSILLKLDNSDDPKQQQKLKQFLSIE